MMTLLKIRQATREKYERVRRVKRLKFVEVADMAIDAFISTDRDLVDDTERSRMSETTASEHAQS